MRTDASTRLDVAHPARPGSRPMTADVLWAVPRVGVPTPGGEDRLVVPVVTYDVEANRGTSRLWLLDRERPARPLTDSGPGARRTATDPSVSPDGARMAFVRRDLGEPGGKPAPAQVCVLPLDGGEAECVTDLPHGVFAPRWLPDGSGLVFGAWLLAGHLTPDATRAELERRRERPVVARATEARLVRYWDTWLVEGRLPHLFHLDLDTRALRDLTPASSLHFDFMDPSSAFDVSPDGGSVVFQASDFLGRDGRLRADLYRVPLAGGSPERLTADNPAESRRPRFARDGSYVLYGRTEDPDFYADRVRLHRYVFATGRHEPVLTDWDRSPAEWRVAGDGRILLVAEDDARTRLFALGVGEGHPVALTQAGSVTGLDVLPDGGATFLWHSLSHPPEVHVLGASDAAPRRRTHFTDEALADVAFGEVRELRFPGASDVPVQAFVVMPPGVADGAPLPLVHMIHGGPHGMFGDAWFWRWHAHTFTAPGRAAILVNFQGSTSWGQDHAERIQGAWGDRPYHDVMRATDALVAAGVADEGRMAVTGGSYGGYLTAWITTQTDRFRCAVNHAGVFDLTLEYGGDTTWGWHRALGGRAWEDLGPIDRWNPARHLRGMNTPMLVTHGERDYRVPIGQGLLCYGMLKAKGVPARLVYFENENHWVLEPRNSLLWYAEVLSWLDRFIGDGARVA